MQQIPGPINESLSLFRSFSVVWVIKNIFVVHQFFGNLLCENCEVFDKAEYYLSCRSFLYQSVYIFIEIRFKLLLLVYQCVQQTAPTYLCELLHEKKKSKYGIRSYELEHLHIPDSETKTYGDHAFCFSGPREWNKLSLEIRQSKSVEVFKIKLKTLLFKEYYKKKGVCG